MKFKNVFRLQGILFSISLLCIQLQGQSISGSIIDAYSASPIPDCSVRIQNDHNQSETITNTNGEYHFQMLSPGRYEITIRYEGYQTLIAPEVFVTAGKALHFKHHLTPISYEMETIVIRASDTWDERSNAQVEVIGIEQTERFAANFQDPVRVVNTYAGVVQLNDQANHLSVHGLSPVYSKWYLEGMEIVNPNHTNNAGTLTDLPTQAGGGVLMFSSQVLGNTLFSKGPHPIQYTNAMSGVIDLNYRNPSISEPKYSSTLSLIGLEASAEGPFGKSNQNSWLVNYRYSTIGILSALGVPLGDEDIRFQDAHIHFNLSTGKRSSMKLFGFWGDDKNIFEGKENPEEREENKERFDINFENTIYGIGIKYQSLLGSNAVLKSGAVFSSSNANRNEFEILNSQDRIFSQSIFQDNRIFSSFIEHQSKIGTSGKLNIGLQYKWIKDVSEYKIRLSGETQNALGGAQRSQLRPYVSYLIHLSGRARLDMGLAASYWTNSKNFIPEPQVSYYYRVGEYSEVSFRYQLMSQDLAQPISELNQIFVQNDTPEAGIGHLLNLGFVKYIDPTRKLSANVFYTAIDKTVVYGKTQYASQSFDEYPVPEASYDGKERVYGLELSYNQMLANAFFLSSNVTLYKSQIEAQNSAWQHARFDGGYIMNLSLGKEYEKVTDRHQRTFGVSGRFTLLGGIRTQNIDEEQSQMSGITIYQSQIFNEKLSTYIRPDLSIYLIKNKKSRTIRWSLDIQNVGNVQNVAYQYYDDVIGSVVDKNQLGIIPILSWRISF